ncbi:MAG: hypothetical protein AAF721_14430, partial [Myxococcota bacterium]
MLVLGSTTGSTTLLGLLAGGVASVWIGTAPANPAPTNPAPTNPAPTKAEIEAERTACRQACAQSETDSTDRTTCELVCDTRADNRLEGPSVTRWKTEKRMGGPPPGVPVGHPDDDTREVTTTTTTTATRRAAPAAASKTTAAPSPKPQRSTWGARVALASCQHGCDATRDDAPRWACKLRCLRQHPTSGLPSRGPVVTASGQDARPSGATTTTTTT